MEKIDELEGNIPGKVNKYPCTKCKSNAEMDKTALNATHAKNGATKSAQTSPWHNLQTSAKRMNQVGNATHANHKQQPPPQQKNNKARPDNQP